MFRQRMLRRRLRRTSGRVGQSGYMLLLLMLAVAMLTITLLSVATNYRQSIRRDREVEMIHRGVQYERAVRLYYRKNNSYPSSIERLENTNKVRYLRKRYKDPMTPDGTWKIATLTDVTLPAAGSTGLGTPGTSGPVSPSSAGDESNRGIPRTGAGSGSQQSAGTGSPTPGTDSTAPTTAGGTPDGSAVGSPSNPVGSPSNPVGSPSNPSPSENQGGSTGAGDQTGTATTSTPSAFGGGVLGGGAMIGVISKSKQEGIHSFNEKSRYNEWLFIYVPSQEIAQPGHIPNGPYNPKLNATAVAGQGSPAGAPAPRD